MIRSKLFKYINIDGFLLLFCVVKILFDNLEQFYLIAFNRIQSRNFAEL